MTTYHIGWKVEPVTEEEWQRLTLLEKQQRANSFTMSWLTYPLNIKKLLPLLVKNGLITGREAKKGYAKRIGKE